MIGRRVKAWTGETGVVVRWEPLGAAMTDALVREDSGRECWHASHTLRPVDGKGPLPIRREAQAAAREETLRSLREIRRQLVAEWSRPWPGCEHGKALLGMAIDGAISDVENE